MFAARARHRQVYGQFGSERRCPADVFTPANTAVTAEAVGTHFLRLGLGDAAGLDGDCSGWTAAAVSGGRG